MITKTKRCIYFSFLIPLIVLFSPFTFFQKTDLVVWNYPNLENVTPLNFAHAHNDYKHANPLIRALEKGFVFIEADVHLIRQNLYVSHQRPWFRDRKKTLTKLYLDPLFEIFKINNGQIFPQIKQPVCLMIDIKSSAERTYKKLEELLIPYQSMLTHWENGKRIRGAVTIIISGNRPIELIARQQNRWVCIDGRIADLDKSYPYELMPLISDKYKEVFGWNIISKPPSQISLNKLCKIVKQVHEEGKQFRLWKSPEKKIVWDKLLESGVDILNSDSLNLLSTYFIERENKQPSK